MASPAKRPKCRYDFVAFTWQVSFTTLRRKWKCSILKIVSFTKLKMEKVKNIVKIEKYIFKTEACDSFH